MTASATKPTNVAIYTRVSTAGQTAENQRRELAGYIGERGWCAVEYTDTLSGTTDRRPGLDSLLKDAKRRKFSAVVVWSLDRMGRSLPHLVSLIAELESLGIAFVSFKEGLDLSTAAGKLQMHILAALVSSERERLRERTVAGLERARSQGKHIGRPRTRPVAANAPEGTVRELAARWGVSRSTAARWLVSGRIPTTDGTTVVQ
jgi:DNA invertase Pin-like site-specific DNA recombinase